MMTYVHNFYLAAKGKLTTYVAGGTALLAALPDMIHNEWAQAEAALPSLMTYHHKVIVAGALATIWTRVRRELQGNAKPPAAP